MSSERNEISEENSGEPEPLFAKVEGVLEDNRLQVTKTWLARLIAEIDDLSVLESFPTQESIQASGEIIQGLAAVLRDEEKLAEFEPGGDYYRRAASFSSLGSGDPQPINRLSNSLLALEHSIWELLGTALRKEDRELIALIVRLRTALQGITASCMDAYYRRSSYELDRLAHTDMLTGLYNRRYLVQELERHVELFRRYQHPFSVLMLDLDNLKSLNDRYGHPAGDSALKHLSTLMRVNIRDVDIPARYGGDEFMVLMPQTTKDVVELVGGRIADSLYKTKLKVDHSLVALEVSVGSSSCPDDGMEAEELLQEVDASLYRAKDRKAQEMGDDYQGRHLG